MLGPSVSPCNLILGLFTFDSYNCTHTQTCTHTHTHQHSVYAIQQKGMRSTLALFLSLSLSFSLTHTLSLSLSLPSLHSDPSFSSFLSMLILKQKIFFMYFKYTESNNKKVCILKKKYIFPYIFEASLRDHFMLAI